MWGRRLKLAALALAVPLAAGAQAEKVCQTAIGWCPAEATEEGSLDCRCQNADEVLSGLVVDVPRLNPLTRLDAPARTRGIATRAFAGPSQIPPSEYRAYGMVLFKSRASRFNRDRHIQMCEAYTAALAHTTESNIPRSEQMVTVWPVTRDDIADAINPLTGMAPCDQAVDHYGLVQAQNALRILETYSGPDGAYDTDGRGPFLVAWTPGRLIGQDPSIALLVDLSHVDSDAQALEMMTMWHDKIQDDPSLWQDEAVRPRLIDVIRRFFDQNGVILDAVSSL
jgi:hypothetical protein